MNAMKTKVKQCYGDSAFYIVIRIYRNS